MAFVDLGLKHAAQNNSLLEILTKGSVQPLTLRITSYDGYVVIGVDPKTLKPRRIMASEIVAISNLPQVAKATKTVLDEHLA